MTRLHGLDASSARNRLCSRRDSPEGMTMTASKADAARTQVHKPARKRLADGELSARFVHQFVPGHEILPAMRYMNSWLGQRCCRVDKPDGEEASEMPDLPTVADLAPEAIEDPVPQTQSVAPSEVSFPELLITEQELVFGTAAAVPLQRGKIGRRLVAVRFAMSAAASHPRARYYPTRADYLERALRAREMGRL